MQYVTVDPAQAGAFLKAAGQLGLQVHLARVLPETEVVGLYRGAHVEAFTLATLPPCPVFAVEVAERHFWNNPESYRGNPVRAVIATEWKEEQ